MQDNARSYRLTNIDMLRGLVIILMAIDHVRDFFIFGYAQVSMDQPDIPASIYVTRWITHFCAPVFVFLAGTSAGLMAARKTRYELGAFLCKRGIWLIFIEIAVISTAWTFSPISGIPELGGRILIGLQVIWVIGASMIVLAGCQYLGRKACLVIGACIVLGHNCLDVFWPSGNVLAGSDPIWYGLHTVSSWTAGPFLVVFRYPLLAWIGVMLLGYGTAFIFEKESDARNRLLVWVGMVMFSAFVLIRASGLYGDPNPWKIQDGGLLPTFFDFMNLSKYPPSLLFLLATLGPMAVVCGYADKLKGWLKDTLVMFGRVPFAFYIAHFYLIHSLSLLLAKYQGFEAKEFMTFFYFFPDGYGISLGGVYLVWLLVLAILYPFCKWVAAVKSRRKDWWLSYL